MPLRRQVFVRRAAPSFLAVAAVGLLGCQKAAEAPPAAAADAPELRSVAAQRHVESADRLLAEANYEGAVQEFTAALDVMGGDAQPTSDATIDADVLYRRGVAYLGMGFPETAAADFTHALRLRPGLGAALAKRGQAYVQMRDYYKAVRDCTEAIRFDPNSADAYRFRGEAYIARGQFDLAARDLEQAGALDLAVKAEVQPLLAQAYYRWSTALAKAGAAVEAEAWLAKAVALDPALAAAERATETDREGEAVERTVAKQIVDEAAALRAAGADHLRAGQYDAALAALTDAIALQPADAQAYLLRGETLLAAGFPDTAAKDLEQAVLNGLETAAAFNLQAEAFLQLDSPHRAAMAATDALHADPTDATAYLLRGRAYVELGKWDRGIIDLEEALRRNPRLADAIEPALERAYQLRNAAQAREVADPAADSVG